ncbi:nucleoside-diphosphate sugar epimerase/dehydratase [Oleiagrimonas sp. MCCC 1A03011]|uniref:nucleoside-diphosphate sugar epimerase/dehydratase n=1 Tax=Oleiagrimonas sp. MCCC 1A03011 TaxID=1926883 RepID=UPI000DC42DAD|nr:nucleoside-diphosphate sugar epimerase/dehydratase [Oleiagrimonas sp. MCCC 1A03011]RAP57925.1 polysaccharide biosynthesis protein [Oleiagrimonas sp. MCCC 1A03011]
MRTRRLIGVIHPRLAVVLHDLAMVALAWWLAKALRYVLAHSTGQVDFLPLEFPIVLAVQGAVFAWTGLYKGLWRFASLPDLWNIARAAVVGTLGIGLTLFLYSRLAGVPRSVLFLYPVTLSVLLGGPRLAYRFWKDSRLDLFASQKSRRVLVIGAGRAGETLARDLRRDSRYRLVGFVDDDAALRGARVHGIPVLGRLDQLPALAGEVAAEMLLIAQPGASTAQMRRVVELCQATGVPFRTVPRLDDVVAGRAQFNQIKDVAIEDLLGRDSVQLDWTAIRTSISGHTVLVTGGGGSIGSELCRQVARLGASELVIVESCEYNLYRIERELGAQYPELVLHALLVDAGDQPAVDALFDKYRPKIVFHAAAYKHVPMLQRQMREAVRNNVLTTRVVARAADRCGVDHFVLISTDKAVNPTSVMGACKRVAEIFCQNFSRQSRRTHFVTVRFGNVLDSAGSVVPLFREQIRKGGPVTVTHPEISRYFMTIPEACQLILQASALGQGGEIFALDMGEPIRIRDLAEQMIRLAGKEPGEDVPIVFTGLRPGEKLFEELFHAREEYCATMHAKIFLARSREMAWELLCAQLDQLEKSVRDCDEDTMQDLISHLLPEFRWNETPASDNVVPLHPAENEGAA